MEKTVVKDLFQTMHSLIVVVENNRVCKAGEAHRSKESLYRITGVIPSCNPAMADRIPLKVEKT